MVSKYCILSRMKVDLLPVIVCRVKDILLRKNQRNKQIGTKKNVVLGLNLGPRAC